MPLRPSNGKISRPDLAITGLKWHFHSDGGAITGPKWHLLSGFVSLRDRTWIVGDELILLKFKPVSFRRLPMVKSSFHLGCNILIRNP